MAVFTAHLGELRSLSAALSPVFEGRGHYLVTGFTFCDHVPGRIIVIYPACMSSVRSDPLAFYLPGWLYYATALMLGQPHLENASGFILFIPPHVLDANQLEVSPPLPP